MTVNGARDGLCGAVVSTTCPVESVQDFLINLGIMYLAEISTFSLSNVIVKLTKIMNRANKNWAHFSYL